MNKTADSIVAERAPHQGANGRNGAHGDRIAIVELPVLGAPGPTRIPSAGAPLSLPDTRRNAATSSLNRSFCRATETPTGRA